MKFKVGDMVRFLNDTGGGKITRLDVKGYVYVYTQDGFEIPVLANELILQTPAAEMPDDVIIPKSDRAVADKTRIQPPPPVLLKDISAASIPEGLSPKASLKLILGLVPESADAVFKSTINLYLINDSPFYVYFLAGYQQQGRLLYLASGEIEPDTKSFLGDFSHSGLSKISFFHIQALAVCKGHYYKRTPLDLELDISRVDFMKAHTYKENEYFEEKALILTGDVHSGPGYVKTVDLPTAGVLHESAGAVKSGSPASGISDTMEVDLHIEALREDYAHLSNGEIVRIQMNRFRSALEDAISNKAKRIVFIHGVGNGTLKMELRNELKRNYPEYTYQDASFKEYGFGATMIHLR